MRRSISRSLSVIAAVFIVPATLVSACEGDCIIGITNALLGNYSTPFNIAMTEIADSISSQITHNKNHPAKSYLSPIIDEYNKRAYDYMENSVFKSYFHGKCQNPITGINPAGCPNPDCPVVCGTPGSIVHFYSKFRYLAFNSTVRLMDEIIDPSSAAYQKVEKAVLADASSTSGSGKVRRLLRFMRNLDSSATGDPLGQNMMIVTEKREDRVKYELRALLRQFRSLLTIICGGTESGQANGLPSCSWEGSFKQYILTFP